LADWEEEVWSLEKEVVIVRKSGKSVSPQDGKFGVESWEDRKVGKVRKSEKSVRREVRKFGVESWQVRKVGKVREVRRVRKPGKLEKSRKSGNLKLGDVEIVVKKMEVSRSQFINPSELSDAPTSGLSDSPPFSKKRNLQTINQVEVDIQLLGFKKVSDFDF